MDHCYTWLKAHKIQFRWTIRNFEDYRITETEDELIELISSNFSPIKNDNDRFQLRLIIDFNSEMKSVLCWKQFKKSAIVKATVYILSVENKKCFVGTSVIKSLAEDDECHDLMILGVRTLTANPNIYLPNGNLTYGCDVHVFDESVNVSLFYEPELNNHSIGDQFEELLNDENHSDFTFIVNDKVFKSHKIVLMVRSPVFKRMFNNDMKELRTNQCTITDIRPQIFDLMLKFIYTDKLDDDLHLDSAMELLLAAEKYELNGLKEKCSTILHKLIDVCNVIEILLLAKQCHVDKLRTYAENFIEIKKEEIFDSIDFEYLNDNLDFSMLFKKFDKDNLK